MNVAMTKGKKSKLGFLPPYKRIAESLVKEIDSGRLQPGDPVPSERDLAAAHKVSLMTARHALQLLASDGMVRRRPNIGSFVAPPKIQFERLTGVLELSFTEEMLSHGYDPETRVISNSLTANDGEVSVRLAKPLGAKVVRLRRLWMNSGEAFAIESAYLPASRFAGILHENKEVCSLYKGLASSYGVRISHVDEEVGATSADAETAGLLKIKTATSLVRIRQVLFEAATPIAYTITLYRSDRHVVLIRRYPLA
jgi:GntR family transcriptional regulator